VVLGHGAPSTKSRAAERREVLRGASSAAPTGAFSGGGGGGLEERAAKAEGRCASEPTSPIASHVREDSRRRGRGSARTHAQPSGSIALAAVPGPSSVAVDRRGVSGPAPTWVDRHGGPFRGNGRVGSSLFTNEWSGPRRPRTQALARTRPSATLLPRGTGRFELGRARSQKPDQNRRVSSTPHTRRDSTSSAWYYPDVSRKPDLDIARPASRTRALREPERWHVSTGSAIDNRGRVGQDHQRARNAPAAVR